jgi:hypothetical protein
MGGTVLWEWFMNVVWDFRRGGGVFEGFRGDICSVSRDL